MNGIVLWQSTRVANVYVTESQGFKQGRETQSEHSSKASNSRDLDAWGDRIVRSDSNGRPKEKVDRILLEVGVVAGVWLVIRQVSQAPKRSHQTAKLVPEGIP